MDKQATIKIIKILHLALVLGVFMFLNVTFLLADNPIFDSSSESYLFLAISLFTLIFGLFIGKFISNNIIEKCKLKENINDKMTCYMKASIVKNALIEGPILLTLIFFLISNNLYFALFATIFLIFFTFIRPTNNSIKIDLNLSDDEIKVLQ